MKKHSGPAICFNTEEEATDAIYQGVVKEGHVVVIRYEGVHPKPKITEGCQVRYARNVSSADEGVILK
ncbi:MAG: dihydroxy-acid dehydratase [Clostridia bacterium]|nr:dihydroxy-acid dehydratase [Clostridia bacterium]MDN5322464.1 dihydroxy-acid dehydratase [Clostridia bacterium]